MYFCFILLCFKPVFLKSVFDINYKILFTSYLLLLYVLFLSFLLFLLFLSLFFTIYITSFWIRNQQYYETTYHITLPDTKSASFSCLLLFAFRLAFSYIISSVCLSLFFPILALIKFRCPHTISYLQYTGIQILYVLTIPIRPKASSLCHFSISSILLLFYI